MAFGRRAVPARPRRDGDRLRGRLGSEQSDSSRSRGRYGPSGTPGGFGYQRGGDRQPAASQGRMNGCGRGRPSVTGIRSTSAPAHENTDRPGWDRPVSRTARHGRRTGKFYVSLRRQFGIGPKSLYRIVSTSITVF